MRIPKKPHQVGLDELHEELDTTPVHTAARDGKVKELHEILRVDVMQAMLVDKYGLTPLHWACDRGEAEVSRLLLHYNADVNAIEKRMFKRRPLHFAVLAGSEETVRELLSHNADLTAQDYRGWAPIHGAAYSGDLGALEALLDAGSSVMTQLTRQNETALHIAASRGRMEVARLILSKCCPGDEAEKYLLSIKNDTGLTAAQWHRLCQVYISSSPELFGKKDNYGTHSRRRDYEPRTSTRYLIRYLIPMVLRASITSNSGVMDIVAKFYGNVATFV
ncbi:putative ankyrin repeat-containing domain-containing protein [Plasmopara halstedii]